jgi:hypothetical protein
MFKVMAVAAQLAMCLWISLLRVAKHVAFLTCGAWLAALLLLLRHAGDTLQPFCPALGASIMGPHIMSIGSNQNFSIPISVLDAFGSKARSGPGSNWIVALSQNSGDARQLSGNLRGALSGGYVVLQGLSVQAEPGSRLNLTLSAVPPPGSGDKVNLSCTGTAASAYWSCCHLKCIVTRH